MTAAGGDFVESFFAVLTVRANAGTPASPLPETGVKLPTTVWFADAAMAATLPDPTVLQVDGGLPVGIAPPVDVVPGESKLREAGVYFQGAPAAT